MLRDPGTSACGAAPMREEHRAFSRKADSTVGDSPTTQFKGGFVVAGPRCATVSVRVGHVRPGGPGSPFAAGAICPHTIAAWPPATPPGVRRGSPNSDPRVRAVALPRGDVPAFVAPGTGAPSGMRKDRWSHEGCFYYKTLCAIAPEYRGRLSISATRSAEPTSRASTRGRGSQERDSRGSPLGPAVRNVGATGRRRPLIRAAGCYAFAVRGAGFSQIISFLAREWLLPLWAASRAGSR